MNLIVITAFRFFFSSSAEVISLTWIRKALFFFIDCLLCPQIASFSLLASSGADTQVVSAAVCSRSVVFSPGEPSFQLHGGAAYWSSVTLFLT